MIYFPFLETQKSPPLGRRAHNSRNWLPGLHFDSRTGLGVLGGYVGEGVAAANLAGRTMSELILEHDTDESPSWVGAVSRRWEPEPLRWLGVRTSRRLMGSADLSE